MDTLYPVSTVGGALTPCESTALRRLSKRLRGSCKSAIWSVRSGRDGFLHGVRQRPHPRVGTSSALPPPRPGRLYRETHDAFETDTGRAGDG